jgi:hypothetical protein
MNVLDVDGTLEREGLGFWMLTVHLSARARCPAPFQAGLHLK